MALTEVTGDTEELHHFPRVPCDLCERFGSSLLVEFPANRTNGYQNAQLIGENGITSHHTDHGASTMTRSEAPRPKVSGAYISSAWGGGATKEPGVVARARYDQV